MGITGHTHTVELTDAACALLGEWENKAKAVSVFYGEASVEAAAAWSSLAQSLRLLLSAERAGADGDMVVAQVGSLTIGVLCREKANPHFGPAPPTVTFEAHS